LYKPEVAMLQIRLLGQFDVRAQGKRIVIPTRAGQSLLAFLVLNPGLEHRRERLAGMFWPDLPEDNARRSLRTELWRLRKAITPSESTNEGASAEYLITNDIAIRFDPDSEYWLDALEFSHRAGEDAQKMDAPREAIVYFTRALNAVKVARDEPPASLCQPRSRARCTSY
jgi:DNA-binding SARP family transcriptional activator